MLTQSSLYMIGAVAFITLFMMMGTAGRAMVPGRLQSMVEMTYEFVANTVRSSAGHDGMKFFPIVFSLFIFILVLNLAGMLPYGFTVTSHIVITAALPPLVILTVIIYGFAKHGTHFLGLFVPSGVPGWLLPLLVRDRGDLVHLASHQPFRAPVRQHAGGPYRAEDLRGFRRHAARPPASGASCPRCRWPSPSRLPLSSSWSLSCRPMSSRP